MARLLVINPGSASTKISICDGYTCELESVIRHEVEVVLSFPTSYSQKEYRKTFIDAFLKEHNYKLEDFDAFVGRGGLVRPIESGTYLVNEKMIDDLKHMRYGDHVCNLGSILAYDYAKETGKAAYTVDPVVVNELADVAKISGYKVFERESIFHALNQKAVAKRYARETKQKYEDLNLIVAHLGGGISVGLHVNGKVIDVNNAHGGEGPFTLERAGTLPLFKVIEQAFETSYTLLQLQKHLVTKGGVYSYIGTSSGMEITKRIDSGDKEAEFYLHAMCYRIVKEIGSLFFANNGKIDQLILTGGLTHNPHVLKYLKEHIPSILPYTIYPGEEEMLALSEGALRVIKGEEEVKIY